MVRPGERIQIASARPAWTHSFKRLTSLPLRGEAKGSSLAVHVNRRPEGGPIPEVAGVVEEQSDATVTSGAADRLLGPPPGEMERVSKIGEVLGEEHVVEPEVVLGADRSGVHRLIRDSAQDRVEPWWRLPAGHSSGDFDRAHGHRSVVRGE